MRFSILKVVVVAVIALGLSTITARAESVNLALSNTVFTNQTLTNVYVFSRPIDLQSYDSAYVQGELGTMFPNHVAKLKYQWTYDTNSAAWADEVVMTTGTPSSTEQPYTWLAKSIQIPMVSSTVPTSYSERVRRQGRFFRIAVACTNDFTSSTLKFNVIPMNNAN